MWVPGNNINSKRLLNFQTARENQKTVTRLRPSRTKLDLLFNLHVFGLWAQSPRNVQLLKHGFIHSLFKVILLKQPSVELSPV